MQKQSDQIREMVRVLLKNSGGMVAVLFSVSINRKWKLLASVKIEEVICSTKYRITPAITEAAALLLEKSCPIQLLVHTIKIKTRQDSNMETGSSPKKKAPIDIPIAASNSAATSVKAE